MGRRQVSKAGDACRPLVDTLALVASLALGGSAAPVHLTDAASGSSAAPSPMAARPSESSVPAAPLGSAARPPPLEPAPVAPPEPTAPLGPPALPVATATARPPAPAAGGAKPAEAGRSLALEAGALGSVGLLPAVRPGATVAVLLDGRRGPLGYLSFGVWRDGRVTLGLGDRGATIGLMQGAVGGCPLHGASRALTWGACMAGHVGRLRASGFGFASSLTIDRWTGGLGANVYARRPVFRRFYVAGVLELDVPVLRSRLVFEDATGQSTEIFRAAPVGGSAFLRAGYSFE